MDMEALLHGNNPDRLLIARLRHNRQITNKTARRIFIMETIDTMDLIGGINRKRDSIQILHTHRTIKALRMERLPGRSQYPVRYCSRAQCTLLQQLHVATLTERLLFHCIKVLSLKGHVTALTIETANMEELVHGPKSIVGTVDFVIALHTHAEEVRITTGVQVFHKQILQEVHLIDRLIILWFLCDFNASVIIVIGERVDEIALLLVVIPTILFTGNMLL